MRPCPNCGDTRYMPKYRVPPFLVVRCSTCMLVYLANPPDEEALYEAYYDAPPPHPRDYRADAPLPGLAELYAINEQRIAWIRKTKPSGRLLDVGCGRGYFLKTAQAHGFEVEGIDVSERAVHYARHRFGLPAATRTLEEVSRSAERYDVITLWHVLEHFLDPFEALGRIHGLLADDGLCCVEVPNLHSLKFMLSRHKWQGGNHPLYHRTFFTSSTLRRALQEHGFSDVRRIRLSYHLPERSAAYEMLKQVLNVVGLDAFLHFEARR